MICTLKAGWRVQHQLTNSSNIVTAAACMHHVVQVRLQLYAAAGLLVPSAWQA